MRGGQVLRLPQGTGCVRTGPGLLVGCREVGAQEAERISTKQSISKIFIFFSFVVHSVQPPREYSCIYTLRLKSPTAEKWRCYPRCGHSEDDNGGKHSRDTRLFSLVLQAVLTSHQQPRFSPASLCVSTVAKSQSPPKS